MTIWWYSAILKSVHIFLNMPNWMKTEFILYASYSRLYILLFSQNETKNCHRNIHNNWNLCFDQYDGINQINCSIILLLLLLLLYCLLIHLGELQKALHWFGMRVLCVVGAVFYVCIAISECYGKIFKAFSFDTPDIRVWLNAENINRTNNKNIKLRWQKNMFGTYSDTWSGGLTTRKCRAASAYHFAIVVLRWCQNWR